MIRSTVRALVVLLLAGCEAADDVRVLPLPPLERPSPEARLGLPELAGTWRFAGWEIIQGDSTALERTFPSFGELDLNVQRLDSLAGTFAIAGGMAPVVGEVRRDGWVSLVTLQDNAPTAFVAGQYARDTLWLELTSIMPADEWPRDARAAFVRETSGEAVAWLRGTRPYSPTSALPEDSLAAGLVPDSLAAGILFPDTPPTAPMPGAGTTAPVPGTPGPPPAAPPPSRAVGPPSATPPPAPPPPAGPAPAAAPPGAPPSPPAAAPPAPPPPAPPAAPVPDDDDDPAPSPPPPPPPPPPAPPRLLGEPVNPGGR